MNYKARVLAVLVAASGAPFAMASDGTITLNGALTASTCVVSVNGGGKDATVNLPTLSTSTLDAKGKVAGQTNFTMALTGCSAASSVSAFFEGGAGVDISGNLNNETVAANGTVTAGSATNVQLQLVDGANGQVIKAGDSGQRNTNTKVAIAASTTPVTAAMAGNLLYAVQYYATGATTPGSVLGTVTYSLNYQ